jgi:hypothetical protein
MTARRLYDDATSLRNISDCHSWNLDRYGSPVKHGAAAGKDDADAPRVRRNVPLHHKKLPSRGNVKTQFISILSICSGYTTFVLNGNGDSDVHDNDQHTYISRFAARPSDPDGDA